MSEKTYSQQVARVFEIAGYVMFSLALIYPLYLMRFSGPLGILIYIIYLFIFLIIPLLIPVFLIGAGTILFVKYCKHSRGRLDEEKVIPMWSGTFFFNLILLLPAGYLYYSRYFIDERFVSDPLADGYVFLFFTALVVWLEFAVALSATAAFSEIKKR